MTDVCSFKYPEDIRFYSCSKKVYKFKLIFTLPENEAEGIYEDLEKLMYDIVTSNTEVQKTYLLASDSVKLQIRKRKWNCPSRFNLQGIEVIPSSLSYKFLILPNDIDEGAVEKLSESDLQLDESIITDSGDGEVLSSTVVESKINKNSAQFPPIVDSPTLRTRICKKSLKRKRTVTVRPVTTDSNTVCTTDETFTTCKHKSVSCENIKKKKAWFTVTKNIKEDEPVERSLPESSCWHPVEDDTSKLVTSSFAADDPDNLLTNESPCRREVLNKSPVIPQSNPLPTQKTDEEPASKKEFQKKTKGSPCCLM